MIDIAILRASGLTDVEILRVLETEQSERNARVKVLNRIRQRNHRARNAITRDCVTQTGIPKQEQQPHQHVTRDTVTEPALTYLLPSLVATSSESQESKEVIGEGRPVQKPARQPKAAARQMPDGWRPNNHHADLCETLGVPLREVEAVFRDTTRAKGVQYVNWDFGFNTYIRNFNKFNGNGHGKRPHGSKPSSSDDVLAGFSRVFGGGDSSVARSTTPKIPRGKTEFDL